MPHVGGYHPPLISPANPPYCTSSKGSGSSPKGELSFQKRKIPPERDFSQNIEETPKTPPFQLTYQMVSHPISGKVKQSALDYSSTWRPLH